MSNQRVVFAGIAFAIIGVGVGVLIGYFSRTIPPNTEDITRQKPDVDVASQLMNEINPTNLENSLKYLTQQAHIAGGDREEKDLVKFVEDKFKESGLAVEIHPYEVLFSYPNDTDPNYVSILTSEGEELFKSQTEEKILDESQNHTNVINPFNAYSPSGDPQGELVFVNFGRVDDFLLLERNLSVDVQGKICIARYGKIYRGDKAVQAAKYGCIGLILYSDPKEYTVAGAEVYPNSTYLPGTGVQRGKVAVGQGDPETPDYPSLSTAWRAPKETLNFAKIPVTPISYNDAIRFLERMGGHDAPSSWQGGLNITYRLGPGFAGDHVNSSINMHVRTRTERATTHNVIGYIKGELEPDRYVIYGNHRDAWVFGAIDPSSGTAILLELARLLGKAVHDGWRPRRSILFCSWGAEEFGLIGSTEWVEEFQKNLAARAVTYINTDTAITGSYSLYTAAIPSLKDLIYDVTKSIPNPDPAEVEAGRTSLYDTWRRRWPENPRDANSKPFVRSLGSGSDYTMFLQLTGITCIDLAYAYDIRTGIDFYPVYHSMYDSFHYMKTFIDPDFKYHETLTMVMAELGRRLVDDEILSFNCVDYALKLIEHKTAFLSNFGSKMQENNMDTGLLDKALDDFQKAADDFHTRLNDVNMTSISDLEIRGINDQLMQLDRAFIDVNGLPGFRNYFKHVIYAPSQHDKYTSSSFPGLVDSLFDIDADPDQEGRWEEVRRQFSIILYHLSSATSTLKDYVPMKGFSNQPMD